MSDKGPLEYLSEQYDLTEIAEFMDDDELSEALDSVVKLIAKPEIHALKAPKYIVLFQAWSAKFAMQATLYSTLKRDKAGTDNNFKKNIYYTAADNMDKIASALKYYVK